MPVSTANSIARQRAHSKQYGVHAGLVFKRFTPLRRPIYGDSFSQFDVKCQVIFVAAGGCGQMTEAQTGDADASLQTAT